MSEMLQLTVQQRETKGKGANRKLRQSKMVPGIFYNGKGENLMVQSAYLPLEKAYEKLGSNQVFELSIEGLEGKRPALIWKVNRDPVKGVLSHVDFYGVDMKHKMRLEVPVELHGEAKGVKEEGGLLELFRDTIEIESLPGNIPGSIVIDISGLNVGHNVHIEDITPPEGVELIFDENFAVVGVVTQTTMSETLEAEEAAEAAGVEETVAEAEEE